MKQSQIKLKLVKPTFPTILGKLEWKARQYLLNGWTVEEVALISLDGL